MNSDPQSYIPHRPPFLFLDRILEIDPGKSAVAEKDVKPTDPCFAGHFPGYPIYPGVLMIEAINQLAAAVFSGDEGENDDTKMLSHIKSMKFLKPIFPGDRMRVQVKVTQYKKFMNQPVLKGMVMVEGVIFSGGAMVAKGTISYSAVAREQSAEG
jgi:3-hydroxyacyl-[acyl-carrier-protein] dehydratase